MLFCVRQIKVWYKTCANNWPTTGPPKASFRCDGDNDGGTDDDRDDDHEDGYDDEDNEEETSEVDEHQGFFRHVRKHRSPKTNNLFSDTASSLPYYVMALETGAWCLHILTDR